MTYLQLQYMLLKLLMAYMRVRMVEIERGEIVERQKGNLADFRNYIEKGENSELKVLRRGWN